MSDDWLAVALARAVRRRRFCKRGHELIEGETAYAVMRWKGRLVFELSDSSGLLSGCDGQCKYGGPEDHRRLEGVLEVGGTRVVGTTPAGSIWEHRVKELRCRACNRARVAAYRAKRVIGPISNEFLNVIGGVSPRVSGPEEEEY